MAVWATVSTGGGMNDGVTYRTPVDQLKLRMKGQPIHAPLSVPKIEIGSSNDPHKRLRQHRHHENSNYLMNLMDWDEWELSDGSPSSANPSPSSSTLPSSYTIRLTVSKANLATRKECLTNQAVCSHISQPPRKPKARRSTPSTIQCRW